MLLLLGGTVFKLRTADISLHSETGEEILDTSGLNADEMMADFKGRSILFLPESQIAANIHSKTEYSQWQVVGIEKNFPDNIRIHITKRLQIFTLTKGGVVYALDINGYVIGVAGGADSRYIDISRLADGINDVEIATVLTFGSAEAERDFGIIKTMTESIWQLNYDYDKIYTFLSNYQIGDDLTLFTRTGAKIIVKEPDKSLSGKIINAYGVYSDDTKDMTGENVVITVWGWGEDEYKIISG